MALLKIYDKALCEAINRFVQVAFKTQESLFTPGAKIWSPKVRKDLYERFVLHPADSVGEEFMQKFEKQLKDSSSDTIHLAAELLYVQLLTSIPQSISRDKKILLVETVLGWSSANPVASLPDALKEALNHGLSMDMGLVIQRPAHLAFIFEALNKWDGVDSDTRVKLLSDAWEFKRFLNDVPVKAGQPMREILYFFVHPSHFEAITSRKIKKKIVAALRKSPQSPTDDDDKIILDIRKRLSKEYRTEFDFFQPDIKKLWDDSPKTEITAGDKPDTDWKSHMKTLLEQFKQIILYGPPGTGKTREAKRLALALLDPAANPASDDAVEARLGDFCKDDRFDLVVFHPAYEYEQFVGGIAPILKGDQLSFQAKAGVFTRLCRNAKDDGCPSVLIVDEINRGHLPKLLGELVYALEYRGHEVRLPFDCDGSNILIVPKNLYVIATMNSADRSIGHIDVAIRRRFGLYPLGARPEVVRQVWATAGDESYGGSLAGLMKRINDKLGSGHDPSAAVELGVGHSYFLPAPGSSGEAAKKQVQMKWTYQVQPLLREYAQLLNLDADSLKEFFEPLDHCLTPP